MAEKKELLPNVHACLQKIKDFVEEVPIDDKIWKERREETLQFIESLHNMLKESERCLRHLYPLYVLLVGCPWGQLPGEAEKLARCPKGQLPGEARS